MKFGIILSLVICLAQSSAWAQKKTKTTGKQTTQKSTKLPQKSTPPAEMTAEPPVPATPIESIVVEPPPSTEIPSTPAAANPPVNSTPSTAPTEAAKAEQSTLFGIHTEAGLPHPLRIGVALIHSSKMFSGDLNYGTFSLSAAGSSVKMTNFELGLRWHPFSGAFFLGALLGNRTLSAEQTEVISSQSILAKIEIKSNYLTPHLGWLWGAGSRGFFGGMDFGFMTPSGATSTLTTNADTTIQSTPTYQQLDKDVRESGKTLGEVGLPMWTALKVGWLF